MPTIRSTTRSLAPTRGASLYEARRGRDNFVVVDGVEGPMFNRVSLFPAGSSGSVHFSPDSKRVAYLAYPEFLKVSKVMVVDGVPGKEYDDIDFFPQIFSSDSQHVSYAATVGKKQCVVVDSQEGPLYDKIEYIPKGDGNHIAYWAVRGREGIVVCDGKEVAKGVAPRWGFSPDYQHLAHLAANEHQWWIVRDSKEGPHHTVGEPWRTELHWSADSQRLAYRASQSRDIEFVVVDGVQSIYYQLVQPYLLTFSPDSKHFAYWACPASGKWHVFVDKSYSAAYDHLVLNGTKLVFDGPDTLHTLAVRDGEILRVEIKIPSR